MENKKFSFTALLNAAEQNADKDFELCASMAHDFLEKVYSDLEKRVAVIDMRTYPIAYADVELYASTRLDSICKDFVDTDAKCCIVANIMMQYIMRQLIEDGASVYRNDPNRHDARDLTIALRAIPDYVPTTMEDCDSAIRDLRADYTA